MSLIGTVGFHLELPVEPPQHLVDIALCTIELVWRHRVGATIEFHVIFANHLGTDLAPAGSVNGLYDNDKHRFAFAIDQIVGAQRGKVADGLMIRVAAHEAMHAVQHARTDPQLASLRACHPKSDGYKEHALELEADQESLLVIKGYAPDLKGSLPFGPRRLEMPASSPYTLLWDEVERGGIELRVISRTSNVPRL